LKKIINPKILAIPSTAVIARPKYSEILATTQTRPKLLVSPSSVLRFADETEERYFRTFQNETAAELEGWFESSFWDRLILQGKPLSPYQIVILLLESSGSGSFSRAWPLGFLLKITRTVQDY
jgi:hypothetical protein